jgi:hypothetical protein
LREKAAARRLIVIAAGGIVAPPRRAQVLPGGLRLGRDRNPATPSRLPAFRLFDRPKRFRSLFRPPPPAGTPRIRIFWGPASQPSAALILSHESVEGSKQGRTDPEAPVDVARLRLRTAALERALADLPRQARVWRAGGRGVPAARLAAPAALAAAPRPPARSSPASRPPGR